MSKANARKSPTAATIRIKDAKVLKSSHGKFNSVTALEKHRIEETSKNKSRKSKKKEE